MGPTYGPQETLTFLPSHSRTEVHANTITSLGEVSSKRQILPDSLLFFGISEKLAMSSGTGFIVS